MKETTLCYIEKDGKYLMLYRNKLKHDPNKGKWVGIGGKIEKGETPDMAAVREVREETGLILEKYEYKGVVNFISDIYEDEAMHLYYSDKFIGNIKECDEGDLKWIEKDKIKNLPIWEGDKIFLNLLEKDVPFFRLTLSYDKDTLKSACLDGQEIKLNE